MRFLRRPFKFWQPIFGHLVVAGWSVNASGAAPSNAELERATSLFAKAEAYEEAGDFQRALAAFEQTAQIAMTPGIRYHIAFCQDHIGKLLDAARNYAIAQREASAQKNRAAKSVLAVVEQRFNDVASRIPHVTLKLRPGIDRQQVKVLVDAHPANVLPSGTFEIDPGEHEIVVIADGFSRVALRLTMVEKELREVEVQLVPVGPARGHHLALGPSERNLPNGARSRSPVRVGAILATSGAAIATGLGVGAYVLAGNSHEEGKAACAASFGTCDDLKRSVRTWDAVALGAWATAAVLGVTATILWLRPTTALSIGAGRVDVRYVF